MRSSAECVDGNTGIKSVGGRKDFEEYRRTLLHDRNVLLGGNHLDDVVSIEWEKANEGIATVILGGGRTLTVLLSGDGRI